MMRIIVVSIFGALLTACSGSSRVAEIFGANAPSHPPTHYTEHKSGLDNRGETRTTVEAVPQEPPKSVVRNLSEE